MKSFWLVLVIAICMLIFHNVSNARCGKSGRGGGASMSGGCGGGASMSGGCSGGGMQFAMYSSSGGCSPSMGYGYYPSYSYYPTYQPSYYYPTPSYKVSDCPSCSPTSSVGQTKGACDCVNCPNGTCPVCNCKTKQVTKSVPKTQDVPPKSDYIIYEAPSDPVAMATHKLLQAINQPATGQKVVYVNFSP